MSLALLAYAAVALAVLITVHMAAKLYGFLREKEKDWGIGSEEERGGSRSRVSPSTTERIPDYYQYPTLQADQEAAAKKAVSGPTVPSSEPPLPADKANEEEDTVSLDSVPNNLIANALDGANQMSLFDAIKEQMKLDLACDKEGNKWRGWQEVRRDEAARRSTNTMYQRSAAGIMSISHIDNDGRYIELANTSGFRARSENISGWRLIRRMNDDESNEIVFIVPPDSWVKANKKIRVYGRAYAHLGSVEDGDLIMDAASSWGIAETQETYLITSKSEVIASVYWTTTTINVQ